MCRGATGCAGAATHRIAAFGKGGTGAMTAVTRRIAKLEEQFGTVAGKPRILMILSHSGWGLALDQDTCIQILGEGGFLPTGAGIGTVNLLDVPMDLSPSELRKYLREHGAETNGIRPRTEQHPDYR